MTVLARGTPPKLVARAVLASFFTVALVLATVLIVISLDVRSRVRRSVADNLASGRGYTFRGERERHIYPGLPYLLAGIDKVFGHQDRPVVLEDHHLRVGLLRVAGSLERDHPALRRVLQVGDLAVEVLYLPLQQHVPGEEPDDEQGSRPERQVLETEELP